MRNPIKTKTKNQIRCYTYVKSRESATTVVHMGTRVQVVWKEKKTNKKIIIVRTEKSTNKPLKNVTARRIIGNN